MHIHAYAHIYTYTYMCTTCSECVADVYVGVKTHLCNIHTRPCTTAHNTCKVHVTHTAKKMHIYIYLHTYVYACTVVCTRKHMRMHDTVYTLKHWYQDPQSMHKYAYTYTYTRVWTHRCTNTYTHAYIYIYHVRTHTHIHIYTHTHTKCTYERTQSTHMCTTCSKCVRRCVRWCKNTLV